MTRNVMAPAEWAAGWQDRWWVAGRMEADETVGRVGTAYAALTRLADLLVGLALALTALPAAWLLILARRAFRGPEPPAAQTVVGGDGRPLELYRPLRIGSHRPGGPAAVSRWSWVLNAPHLILGRVGLIGPAPLLPAEREIWQYLGRSRRQVRPGLVGLADVGGRPEAGALERLQLDQLYLANRGPALDLGILARVLLRSPLPSGARRRVAT